MNVLIACEESQRSCIEFRKRGHRTYSCDIQSCSGYHPEWHIKGDVIPLLNGHCSFETQDGHKDFIMGEWDLIIAHPPCTYLTCTGNSWFNVEKYGDKALKRIKEREKAFDFFMQFVNANCKHIAIENPIGYPNTHYRKPDQIIHPYMFGEPERKATCLWLKNLPKLIPTEIVEPNVISTGSNHKTDSAWHIYTRSLPPYLRAKERSKTFKGIARAFAEQWGD